MSDSWGNLYRSNQRVVPYLWRSNPLPACDAGTLLPVGARRSYGDVCVNHDGIALDATHLSRFIHFDSERGVLRCEAGVSLNAVSQLIVPFNWFLPVSPGTSFATVGGAVANDVHGKNHHIAGSFGRHVTAFELLRSNGDRFICSPDENAELFTATIGGLGLTGLLVWVEFSLLRIPGTQVKVESESFSGIQAFARLSDKAHDEHEYCVSWIDCSAAGSGNLHGIFMQADHVDGGEVDFKAPSGIQVPGIVGMGFPLVNRLSVSLFNRLYRWRNGGTRSYRQSMFKYFYPLDALQDWNRIYGPRGFYQFQCVVPTAHVDAIDDMLKLIRRSGQGSFLSVLKMMGAVQSPGLMSFSRPGLTLALDFPNKGNETRALLKRLEAIVVESDGALYPAKDALMSGESFRRFFPRWEEMQRYIDPAVSSTFWRRVTAQQ